MKDSGAYPRKFAELVADKCGEMQAGPGTHSIARSCLNSWPIVFIEYNSKHTASKTCIIHYIYINMYRMAGSDKI